MEEDVDLCPYWRQRMEKELPQAPADAEIIKLYFFGHWRKEDEVDKSCRKNGYPWTFRRMLTTPGSRMTDLSARKSEIRPLKLGDRGGVDGLRVQR